MSEDYCQILRRVLLATHKTELKPTLTFNDSSGWWFDGVCYGKDEAAAVGARNRYYNNPDDLENVL